VLKLVLQNPSTVNALIGFAKIVEDARIGFGAVVGVFEQEPAQSLKRFSLIGRGPAPLLLANLIERLVESLDDVEAIENNLGVGAELLDGADKGLRHVAGGDFDGFAPVFIKRFGEETLNGLTSLAAPGPDDAVVVQIVYQGKIFVSLLVRNFVDADFRNSLNLMAFSITLHDAV